MDSTVLLTNFIISSTFALGLVMLIIYILNKDNVKETLSNSGKICKNTYGSFSDVLSQISKMITPKMGTKFRDFYEKMLIYNEMSVEKFFQIKNGLFVITFIFIAAITLTDMNSTISGIFNTFEYVKNPLFNSSTYTEEQKKVILEQKNEMFNQLIEDVGLDNLATFSDSDAESIITSFVLDLDNNTGIDAQILATEMLAKVKAYNSAKEITLSNAIMFALIMYFMPEIVMYVIKFLNKSQERAEKRFLKRLIIMNGSIKPTDFMMVLTELIDKSKYFKKILLEIEDFNKKNYEENTKIYSRYIREADDVETKLFFEKLDEANNYDFDQAIMNIKNEFNLDKRMQTRKCKKMVETIHVYGLLGFMALIVMIIFYLLMPWLEAYDLSTIM